MSHEVFFEIGLAEARLQRPQIAEETIRAKGSAIGTHIHIAAAMAEEVEFDGVTADEDGYLDSATGDALTRYVASEYGEPRHGATSSTVELVWSRAATTALVVDAGTTVEAQLSDGRRVRFTQDTRLEWTAGDDSDKSVQATSVEVGPDTNVTDGTITSIVSSLSDATLEVTNPEPAAGGNVEEQDDQLKARVRDVMARRVRGTATAVRLGAMEVARVREAAVFESLDSNGDPSGGGTVVIGDDSGQGNAALIEDVRLELYEWRPLGAKVAVVASSPVYQAITVQTIWDPGHGSLADKVTLQQLIAARVNKLQSRADPATVDAADVDVACKFTHDIVKEVRPLVDGLKSIEVTVPVGSVVPSFGEAIRTRPELVTVT